jgi:hypothetical protein
MSDANTLAADDPDSCESGDERGVAPHVGRFCFAFTRYSADLDRGARPRRDSALRHSGVTSPDRPR